MTKTRRRHGAARKPHNAKTVDYGGFGDLLTLIADEPRRGKIDGKDVTITRVEALLRAMVDRAASQKTRELIKLLQMMAKDPGLAAKSPTITVIHIGGALAIA
ncbi:hypothetical protein [Sphingomonas humi]|uniref:DUF5681 domain-containing protein n=1 Tax=Sphingomonas humi TaxID=335630 RepID=A0ABP7RX19_9SPHN